METLPLYIPLVFLATLLLTVSLFYRATGGSTVFLAVAATIITVQSVVSLTGFYTVVQRSGPPRFALMLVPTVLLFVFLFRSQWGKHFLDSLSPERLTLLHTVRIPVELVLYWLFLHKAVPQLMTFEGRNFDILSGLSAPVVYYLVFVRKAMGRTGLLVWNIICLGLVVSVAVHGLLSAQTPLQQFAFEQPNVALAYFPFVLLPAVIVPLVLLSHIASIRLLRSKVQPTMTSRPLIS